MDAYNNILLDVKGLKTYFFVDEGIVKAVDGVDFTIKQGMIVGVVGESGCGKSVTALSLLKLVTPPGQIVEGQILLYQDTKTNGHQRDFIDLAALKPNGREIRSVRGREISMIFQEPMTALSVLRTIGDQIMEAILVHSDMNKKEARQLAVEMLRRVSIPKPEDRVDAYPFQLSGGLRQRAMIAMALSCNPRLLIADEPTTALDVTTQAQILELMKRLKQETNMSILLITHDLGVVAEMCEEVVVMYLGLVMEQANVDALFYDPLHPYTRALLHSIPRLGQSKKELLNPIKGMVPDPYNRPRGCPFHPRCPDRMPGKCNRIEPPMIELLDGRTVRCWLYGEE
jgi:peptide/nickel transport system ATP-binding protein